MPKALCLLTFLLVLPQAAKSNTPQEALDDSLAKEETFRIEDFVPDSYESQLRWLRIGPSINGGLALAGGPTGGETPFSVVTPSAAYGMVTPINPLQVFEPPIYIPSAGQPGLATAEGAGAGISTYREDPSLVQSWAASISAGHNFTRRPYFDRGEGKIQSQNLRGSGSISGQRVQYSGTRWFLGGQGAVSVNGGLWNQGLIETDISTISVFRVEPDSAYFTRRQTRAAG